MHVRILGLAVVISLIVVFSILLKLVFLNQPAPPSIPAEQTDAPVSASVLEDPMSARAEPSADDCDAVPVQPPLSLDPVLSNDKDTLQNGLKFNIYHALAPFLFILVAILEEISERTTPPLQNRTDGQEHLLATNVGETSPQQLDVQASNGKKELDKDIPRCKNDMQSTQDSVTLPPDSTEPTHPLTATGAVQKVCLDVFIVSVIIFLSVMLVQLYTHVGTQYAGETLSQTGDLDVYSALSGKSSTPIHICASLAAMCVSDTCKGCNLQQHSSDKRAFSVFFVFATLAYALKRIIKAMPDMVGTAGTLVVCGITVAIVSWDSRAGGVGITSGGKFKGAEDHPIRHCLSWLNGLIAALFNPYILALVVLLALGGVLVYAFGTKQSVGAVLWTALVTLLRHLKPHFLFGSPINMARELLPLLFKDHHRLDAKAHAKVEPIYYPAIKSVSHSWLLLIVDWSVYFSLSAPSLLANRDSVFRSGVVMGELCENLPLESLFSSAMESANFDTLLADAMCRAIHMRAGFSGYQYLFSLVVPVVLFLLSIWNLYRKVIKEDARSVLHGSRYLRYFIHMPKFVTRVSSPWKLECCHRADGDYNFLVPVLIGGLGVVFQHVLVQHWIFHYHYSGGGTQERPRAFIRSIFGKIVPVQEVFASILAYMVTEPLSKRKYHGKLGFVEQDGDGDGDAETTLKPIAYRIYLSLVLLVLRRTLIRCFSSLFHAVAWYVSVFLYISCSFVLNLVYTNGMGRMGEWMDVLCVRFPLWMSVVVVAGCCCLPLTIPDMVVLPENKILAHLVRMLNSMLNLAWTVWLFLKADLITMEGSVWALFSSWLVDAQVVQKALGASDAALETVHLALARMIGENRVYFATGDKQAPFNQHLPECPSCIDSC